MSKKVDEKLKVITGELIKKREKPAEIPTVKISGDGNSVVIGATIQGGVVTGRASTDNRELHQTHITHQSFAEKEADIQSIIDRDPSAHKQGRKPLGWRKRGERVKPEFMTPKEYTNFTAQTEDGTPIWDGIERKFMRLNWEPWDWGKETKANLPPVNRRVDKDRRKPWAISTGYDRRKPHSHGKRHEDIMSQRVRVVTLLIGCSILGTIIILAFLKYYGVIN